MISGDLGDVEEGGDARQDVLADRGGGGHKRVVGTGQRDDQRGERLGEIVGKARVVGDQHLGDTGKLRRLLGDGSDIRAGYQNVDVAADFLGRRQRLGRLVGKVGGVVVSQKQNGHDGSLRFLKLKARRLRS
ncbi:hypothetical protein ABIA25_006002 [Sinorhizobium fredii]